MNIWKGTYDYGAKMSFLKTNFCPRHLISTFVDAAGVVYERNDEVHIPDPAPAGHPALSCPRLLLSCSYLFFCLLQCLEDSL